MIVRILLSETNMKLLMDQFLFKLQLQIEYLLIAYATLKCNFKVV